MTDENLMEEAKEIIKEKQKKLEVAILTAVLEYETDTGMSVRDISFVQNGLCEKKGVIVVSTLGE